MLRELNKYILEILFPAKCLGCGQEGLWLCRTCSDRLIPKSEHCCPVCEKALTPAGNTCFACKKKTSLDALFGVFPYESGLLKRAVHSYKYRFVSELHLPLGNFLTTALQASALPLPDLLLPVPLHPRRLRWRGFNQALLLATGLSENLAPGFTLPLCSEALQREKYTPPQMEIPDKQRRRTNVQDAFVVTRPEIIKGRNILLVDDVATTGSTLCECAKVLKKSGAAQVWAIVIARQELKNKTRQPLP